jgi:hypothetical protein
MAEVVEIRINTICIQCAVKSILRCYSLQRINKTLLSVLGLEEYFEERLKKNFNQVFFLGIRNRLIFYL